MMRAMKNTFFAGLMALTSAGAAQAQDYVIAADRAPYFERASLAIGQGNLRASRHFLEALLHTSPGGGDLALTYQGLDAVDRADPWSFGVWGSLLPSNNVTGVATARTFEVGGRTFTITGGGEPKKGIGLQLGGRASYNMVVGPGVRLRPEISVTRVAYRKYTTQNRWIVEPALNFEIERPRITYGAKVFSTRSYYANSDSSQLVRGLQLSTLLTHAPEFTTKATLSHSWIDADKLDHYDGKKTVASLTTRRKMNDRLTLNGTVTASRRLARNAHLGYLGFGGSVGFDYLVTPENALDGSIGVERRRHHAAIPGIGVVRVDKDLKLELGWTNGRFQVFGSAPRFGCTHARTQSNVALYTTKSTDCALTFVRRF